MGARQKTVRSLRAVALVGLGITACDESSSSKAERADGSFADAGGEPARDSGETATGPDGGRQDTGIDAADADVTDASEPNRDDASTPDAGEAVSMFCGDRIRDPVLEECDDGPGAALDVCASDCKVRETWLGDETAARTWGLGPHVLTGNPSGIGATFVKHQATPTVWLAMFNGSGGAALAPVEVSSGKQPTAQPHPCVAALPSGDFVVAWTDIESASPDILLRKVSTSGVLSNPIVAHQLASGPQQDADLIWTGKELVAAWTDATNVKVRTFDANLTPQMQEAVLAGSDAIESSVVLSPLGDSYAAAFRVGAGGTETIRVVSGNLTWQVSPAFLPGPEGDRPALASLDGTHLLLAFAEGVEPLGAGTGTVPRLRFAILSTEQPGDVSASALMLDKEPYASDDSLAQKQPRVAVSSDTAALLWQQASNAGADGEEVMMATWRWDAAQEQLVPQREQPLHEPSAGQQTIPALGTSPLYPGGALIMGFQQSSPPGPRLAPDLLWTLRPLPWVDLTP